MEGFGGNKKFDDPWLWSIVLVLLLLVSCDATKVMAVDGQMTKKVNFEYGTVSLTGVYGLGPQYIINIHVESHNKPIQMKMDCLQFFHKGNLVSYDYTMKKFNGEISDENLILPYENRFINLLIDKESVPSGDTLSISAIGFLKCNTEPIFTKPIELILRGTHPKRFNKFYN